MATIRKAPANWDYDVVVIGAGLSGITAAYYLKTQTTKSFIVLERHSSFGGTWELFKYPGIRSDSDMYSFSFSFHPWQREKWFGSAQDIKAYLKEIMDKFDLHDHFRYNTTLVEADFDTATSTWTTTTTHGETVSSNFFLCCSGYYDHEEGFTPEFKGADKFSGEIIHPQFWPEDYNYEGKNVVVIGSGATAITVVPEIAKKANVTMLQRSPTYIGAVPDQEGMNIFSRTLYAIFGQPFKNVLFKYRRVSAITWGYVFFYFCKRYPNFVKKAWLGQLKKYVAKDDMKHFTPSYNPWDQRVCAAPNADFFKSYLMKKFNIVTDHIEEFTEDGILLKSGEHLNCDTIITATGLKLLAAGGVKIKIDGQDISIGQQVTYKGIMLTNVPNLFWVTGYTNASWTLKAELSCDHITRMMNYMQKNKKGAIVPVLGDDVKTERAFDLESGYVLRYLEDIPKQGDKYPWKVYQNYFMDMWTFSGNNFEDGVAHFSKL